MELLREAVKMEDGELTWKEKNRRRELMTWKVLWELHSQCMGSVGLWSTKKRTSWSWTTAIVNSCCVWTKKLLAPNALSIHFCIHQSHLLTTWCGYPQSVYSMLHERRKFDANKSWASDHLWPRLLTATRWTETYQNLHLIGTHRKQLHMWTSLSLPIRSAMHQQQKHNTYMMNILS